MKKLSILILSLGISILTYAQPVADNAVIPVSVNLNSILRLNVTSGGNIEFTFTNIDQYTNGLANTDRYDTHFTVASSVDFDVDLSTEDATFIGADNPANTMALNFVAYEVTSNGSGVDGTNWNFIGAAATPEDLTQTPASPIVESVATLGAGDVTQNAFIINWECGTTATTGGSLLAASLPADRYTTNVYLVLSAQ
ncbi:MAG: hypothetical protein WCX31_12155 [Salinivirgaceae bacterium]|jgi:hypothetical protein